MKRRTRYLRRILWLAGFGCLWLNVLDDPPLWTGPYVQDVTDVAATVAVISASPSNQQLTVFGPDGDEIASIESPSQRRHAVRVGGLQANQAYTYSLKSKGGGEQ